MISLSQPLGAIEVGRDGGFEFFDHGEAALDFGDDAVALGQRRKRDDQRLQLCAIHIGLPDLLIHDRLNPSASE
ncbi:MAG: hypothetical protein M3436_07570 [Pseudomonadota bacterium]|nr:hypothetical protein [Pseudomonadota bacterium]